MITSNSSNANANIVILGGGVAGVSYGWTLAHYGIQPIVFEKSREVGGLSRSFVWEDFDCDFAAHRLFSPDKDVTQRLINLIPMEKHVRRSSIYFDARWLKDPLDTFELLFQTDSKTIFQIVTTYLFRNRNIRDSSFQSYVEKRYGKKLYKWFFRPYTEKLFGISGSNIALSWAKAKVRLANPLDRWKVNTRTKFSSFYYPSTGGYGSIPDKLASEIENLNLNTTVTNIVHTEERITSIEYTDSSGNVSQQKVDLLVSTIPLTILARMLNIQSKLSYRAVTAVYLLVDKPYVSDNHWIYFMDDDICVNRVVEFKNMSSIGKPKNTSVICAEVTRDTPNVEEQVIVDLIKTGLIERHEVLSTMFKKEEFAYPIYSIDYEEEVARIRKSLSKYTNLEIVGRAAEFQHRELDDTFAEATRLAKIKALSLQNNYQQTSQEKTSGGSLTSTKKSIWVVILAYNNIHDTIECIESTIKSTYENLGIILVDNGSTDETPDIIRKQFPSIHVIENGENLWVPGGYNVGVEYALDQKADYIFILNNDTVLETDTLEILISGAEDHPDVGVVMPTINFYDKPTDVWSSGARYRRFPPAIVLIKELQESSPEPIFIEYAPTCGLLVKSDVFEKIGLLDTSYLFLNDDYDFCHRVTNANYKILHTPSAKMLHKVSQTATPQTKLYWRVFAESHAIFYRRNNLSKWLSLPVHLGYLFAREFLFKQNWKFLPDFIEGLKSGLTKSLAPIPFPKEQ